MKYLYQVNEQNKFIYFIVPKCATRSMFNIFEFQPVKFRSIIHNYQSYYSWAFVRNPFDRLLSAYIDKIVNKTKGGLYPYRHCNSFTEFIYEIRNLDLNSCDRHIRLQSTLFPNDINFVGKLENYENDLNNLLNKFNMQNANVHINKTNHTSYIDYYTNETMKIVGDMYYKDFKKLGYELG